MREDSREEMGLKTLRFTYHMELRFSQPVTGHNFTFRCFPKTDDMQKISDVQIDIQPCDWYADGEDSFGNRYIYGVNESEHNRLYIGVSGHAQTGIAQAVTAPALKDCGMFRCQDDLTRPGEAILDFDSRLQSRDPERFSGAGQGDGDETGAAEGLPEYLCHAVYGEMQYVPGATHFGTTAEQAFAGRQGVCQDYSHILLSLLRLHGIPCRYVAGILVGVGKSHAWVEAWEHGRWHAYDPTNDVLVTDSHISFARGRNCMDTLVNRGVFHGQAEQRMYVTATAVEVGLESYFS